LRNAYVDKRKKKKKFELGKKRNDSVSQQLRLQKRQSGKELKQKRKPRRKRNSRGLNSRRRMGHI
jgi:UDP-glucose 4-epimerase